MYDSFVNKFSTDFDGPVVEYSPLVRASRFQNLLTTYSTSSQVAFLEDGGRGLWSSLFVAHRKGDEERSSKADLHLED
jgi:hypothetical protein